MIEQSIYSALTTCPPIIAITTAQRIYPVALPQDTTDPALTFRISQTIEEPTLETSGLEKLRVQIDSWANDYFDAANLRAALVSAFNGYQDAAFTALLINKADYFEPDLLKYRCVSEWHILSPSLS